MTLVVTASEFDPENPSLHIEKFRRYLLSLAEMRMNPRLKQKEDPADVVQLVMLEAFRDLPKFRGRTEAELKAWLKSILFNRLNEQHRRYSTQKRGLNREVSLEKQLEESSQFLCRQLAADQSTPSAHMMKQEQVEQLADALSKLLDDERTVIVLKHFHHCEISEIATHISRTPNAVIGLLRRGLHKLRETLERS